MPLYGDLDQVKAILRPDETSAFGADIGVRLASIQKAVSLLLEEKCGRTWGEEVADTSILHWAYPGQMLMLTTPARSITSVQYGGELVGETMTGGETLTASDIIFGIVDQRGLVLSIGVTDSWSWSWSVPLGQTMHQPRVPVVVTGDFADSSDSADIPDDVTYAANLLILEQFRRETASPAGFTGPDGSTVPVRNQWNDPTVRAVIEKYAIRKVPVF